MAFWQISDQIRSLLSCEAPCRKSCKYLMIPFSQGSCATPERGMGVVSGPPARRHLPGPGPVTRASSGPSRAPASEPPAAVPALRPGPSVHLHLERSEGHPPNPSTPRGSEKQRLEFWVSLFSQIPSVVLGISDAFPGNADPCRTAVITSVTQGRA
jgi:hypothetical protein